MHGPCLLRSKVFFQNMTRDVWLSYMNFLLGEKVHLMQVPAGGKGGKMDQAPRAVVLN